MKSLVVRLVQQVTWLCQARLALVDDRKKALPARRNRIRGPFLAATVFAGTFLLISSSQILGQLPFPLLNQPRRLGRLDSMEQAKRDAEDAYRRGEYTKAVELANSVLQVDPTDHVALYLRASARVELGRTQNDAQLLRDGIADAREAIRLTQARTASYYLPYIYGMVSLAAVEKHRPHAEVALQVADQVLQNPQLTKEERANLLYQRAGVYGYLQRLKDAVRDYEEAIRLQPSHLGAYLALAEAHASAGEMGKAEQAFDRAARAFPNSPLVFNNRGMFRQRRGEPEKAIADFSRAIELDPNFAVAYINRGFSLLESGKYEAAENDLTAAIRIDPQQPTAYSLRGTARLCQAKLKEAISDYEKVLGLDPNSAVAQADLGFARFFSGDYQAAVTAFDRALERDPSAVYLITWRYWAAVRAGREQEAKAWLQQHREQVKKSSEWVDHLVAFLTGEIDQERLLKMAEAAEPGIRPARACEAHYFIGQRHQHAGRSEQAAEHYRQALKTEQRHLSAYRGAKLALGASGNSTQ
ncbi:MAG: tetratricopeptide repeat protein [Planctomycetes bacterium]|nr:tetratricopeptide repeat protein [Planctomycetota bacterium]